MLSTQHINDLLKDATDAIVPVSHHYPAGYDTSWHMDIRGQLTSVLSGVLVVTNDEKTWVVPPQRAVWIPAFQSHKVEVYRDVLQCNLFIRDDLCRTLPKTSAVIQVSPLVRELTLELLKFTSPYDETGAEGRLIQVLVDQLSLTPAEPLLLPYTREPRLKQILDFYLDNPADTQTIQDWSNTFGVSTRTLSRLFESQLGMNFTTCRQQIRLLVAVRKLAEDFSVARAAVDVGFQSQSSFTALFRRTFGVTPKQYFAR